MGINQAIVDKNQDMMICYLKKFYNFFDGIFFDNVLDGDLFDHFHAYLEVHAFISEKNYPQLHVALSLGLKDFICKKQDFSRSKVIDLESIAYQYARCLYHKIRPETNLVDLSFLRPNRIRQSIYGKPPKVSKFIFPEKYLWQMDSFYWFNDEDAIYLSSDEKKALKLKRDLETGLLKRSIDKDVLPDGIYTYIISPKGGLYLANSETPLQKIQDQEGCIIHHSTFRSGQPILCGGMCIIKDGEIIEININTGHYLVSNDALIMACVHLYYEGLIKLSCATQGHKREIFYMRDLMKCKKYQFFQKEYLQLKLGADLRDAHGDEIIIGPQLK